MIMLKPNRTHGRYMALNWVPNQKLTMVSLFNWHHTYRMDITMGSIRKGMDRPRATITASSQLNKSMNK